MQRIDVGIVEDHAAPPRPAPLSRLRDQIEIARSGPQAGELRVLAAIKELESQRAIKTHCAPHVVGRERDRTDALDHAELSYEPTLRRGDACAALLATRRMPRPYENR